MVPFEFVAEPPQSAFMHLAENPYGFCLVDLQIPPDDLIGFREIDVQKNSDFHEFGDGNGLEEKVFIFLNDLGVTDARILKRAAFWTQQIANEVLAISGKPQAWFCLRSMLPTHKYDLPRWHIDGHYYRGEDRKLQYKFVMALLGKATLLYPLSRDRAATRRVVWMHMSDRQFTSEIFQPEWVVSPSEGIGAFFIAADSKKGGLHSEPPIHENRIFFSIVPCCPEELIELEQKVLSTYKTAQE